MENEVSVEPQIGEVPKLREDILAGLVQFGYAPGNYAGTCQGCGNEMWNVAKRSYNCVDCAIKSALDLNADLRAETDAHLKRALAMPTSDVAAQVFAAKARVFASAYGSARTETQHVTALANAVEALERFIEVATGNTTPKRR